MKDAERATGRDDPSDREEPQVGAQSGGTQKLKAVRTGRS